MREPVSASVAGVETAYEQCGYGSCYNTDDVYDAGAGARGKALEGYNDYCGSDNYAEDGVEGHGVVPLEEVIDSLGKRSDSRYGAKRAREHYAHIEVAESVNKGCV